MSFARPGSKLLGESLKQRGVSLEGGLNACAKTLNTLHTESVEAVLAHRFPLFLAISGQHVSTDMNPGQNGAHLNIRTRHRRTEHSDDPTLVPALLRHLIMTPWCSTSTDARQAGRCSSGSTLPMIATASGKSVRSFHCICVSAASIASCVESRIRNDSSEYSQDSINHPYARYGSRYSRPGSHNLRGLSCGLALRISTSDNGSATTAGKKIFG